LVRLEQNNKGEQRTRNEQDGKYDTTDDRQPTLIEQSDDSSKFDLLMSCSNNVTDQILCHKIADRLKKKNYQVYTKKQGKNRLALMQIAAAKKIPILACISSKFHESKYCMAEVDYANSLKCPIIPVVVGSNCQRKGWVSHILASRKTIDFARVDFNASFMNLILEIEDMRSQDERIE
jgi:hypothetical protein